MAAVQVSKGSPIIPDVVEIKKLKEQRECDCKVKTAVASCFFCMSYCFAFIMQSNRELGIPLFTATFFGGVGWLCSACRSRSAYNRKIESKVENV